MQGLEVVKEDILNTEVTCPFAIDKESNFFESFKQPKSMSCQNYSD